MEYDSLPTFQRLGSPKEFESWKRLIYKRLRERGLSHVPLVPPVPSRRDRDERDQRQPTADELRRVTVMLKFSVISRVRNEFLGGSYFREERPWDIWSKILKWAGKLPEKDNQDASYTPSKPVKPQGPRVPLDKLGFLLRTIATMDLGDFDSFGAYVARFNDLRKKLLDIGCSLTEKQYIALFIIGIEASEEHQAWVQDVKEAMETKPSITLDWVLSIASAKPKQSSSIPEEVSPKPSYDNIKEKPTNVGCNEPLRIKTTGLDEANNSKPVQRSSTSNETTKLTTGERNTISCPVEPTKTLPSQLSTPSISKTASPTSKKVTFGDKPQPYSNAGLDGKSATLAGQNKNKTSDTLAKGSSSANPSVSKHTKVDKVDPNSSVVKDILTSTTADTSRPKTLTVPQCLLSAVERDQSSSNSPAMIFTALSQANKTQANPSVPGSNKPQNGSREASPVVSISNPQLPSTVKGGAVKDKVLVDTRPTSSPVLTNAYTSKYAKESPILVAKNAEASEKSMNDTSSISKKRALPEETGKEPTTTGPPIKKRVSALELMQSMLSKRR